MFLAITGENFRQEVLDASGLVLVSFWAPWCGACRWVNPTLNQFQSQVNTPLKIVSVNADNNFSIVNTYRLTTLPTLLVFYQGQVCDRIEGFQSRDQFNQALDRVRSQILDPLSA
ncbi:MAG: thioredoxin family protein [Prochlorothrix sp.]|nr:thioredoxin domain-containing protein [Prochlorothrix sp.]